MNKEYTPAEAKAWLAGYDAGKAFAKKEWVGLTKDEVNNWELPESPTVYEFAQFVEAKLKEKNAQAKKD